MSLTIEQVREHFEKHGECVLKHMDYDEYMVTVLFIGKKAIFCRDVHEEIKK